MCACVCVYVRALACASVFGRCVVCVWCPGRDKEVQSPGSIVMQLCVHVCRDDEHFSSAKAHVLMEVVCYARQKTSELHRV